MGYLSLIFVAVIAAGMTIWKIESIENFIDEQHKKDLEWELRKYRKK